MTLPRGINAQRRRKIEERTRPRDWLTINSIRRCMSEEDYYVRDQSSVVKASRDLSFLCNVANTHIAGLSDRQLIWLRDILARVYGVAEKRIFEQYVIDVTGRQL